ncbi:nicotinamide-nucleotide amidase [Endobacter medicaginis]|uniref:Nicotinamide-nucleotide amidase n=2 Tax=Endobacter medicaginis TaxID=1181271 RepID=A0A839UZK2_9PROT|nr:CinA family protein [Endobacter medicaginis]MBB3172719.1 nicotinamide-nucleotide amidase [Endobacter medicaginis]MCX5474326.1 CinA family protein [Endobacter medicaginis]
MRDAAPLVAALIARGLRVGTAESLTGGLIAARLTAMAGASACVVGGFVTYTDAAKHALLGVERELLAVEGAVSEAVACAMARGARARLGVDLAVSATGYAGPQAGPDGEVGLVWLAIASAGGVSARRYRFGGDRAAVRDASVDAALALIAEAIGGGRQENGGPEGPPSMT